MTSIPPLTPGAPAAEIERAASSAAPCRVDDAFAADAAAVCARLGVDPRRGLDDGEATDRLARCGENRLRRIRARPVVGILFDQFASFVVALLLAAAVVSLLFGSHAEALAIGAVILANGLIGFFTELRAVRSMEALRALGEVTTTVLRDGLPQRLPAQRLVPGDIVLVEGGDVVSADLRLCEAVRLQAEEAALTGESVPTAKTTATLPAGTHLNDRHNQLFKGTTVSRGNGVGVVVATGLDTELGRISRLVESAAPERTPLERRLDRLGRRLIWVTLALTAVIAVAGVLGGRDLILAIQVAVALAIAAIPEGLPVVATIALARGMWRMARRNAVVSRLSAVETLGTADLILTDKTGTLTENRMTLVRLAVLDDDLTLTGTGLALHGELTRSDGGGPPSPSSIDVCDELLACAALCNSASLGTAGDGADEATAPVGDPTEVALLVAAAKRGLRREALLQSQPEVREEPFDPATRAMATWHQRADDATSLRVAVKGAPEVLLATCIAERAPDGGERPLDDARRAHWLERAEALAADGHRTLAIATRDDNDDATPAPYAGLTLLGLVGLADPPRAGVREALDRARAAGVDVVMVTGDHAATARAVGARLGLLAALPDQAAARDADEGVIDAQAFGPFDAPDADVPRLLRARVVARADPEQKLQLIRLHQQAGRIVAMTGDGVNDAPALVKADIGVAMGVRGTQVAKQAADMILQDDAFETIVHAIAQGRAIYGNIRKFVLYLLSCNVSELMIVGLATAAGAPLPLLPLQILFLNLVTDVFPALALGVGRGSEAQMRRPPRAADENVLTGGHWLMILISGAVICASVLGAMALAIHLLGASRTEAVTVSFLTLAFAQLWHVFNVRSERHWRHNEIVANRWVWGALALCIALTMLALLLPPVRTVLQVTLPNAATWGVIVIMSLLPLVLRPLAGRRLQP